MDTFKGSLRNRHLDIHLFGIIVQESNNDTEKIFNRFIVNMFLKGCLQGVTRGYFSETCILYNYYKNKQTNWKKESLVPFQQKI